MQLFNGCFFLWASISNYVLSYMYIYDKSVDESAVITSIWWYALYIPGRIKFDIDASFASIKLSDDLTVTRSESESTEKKKSGFARDQSSNSFIEIKTEKDIEKLNFKIKTELGIDIEKLNTYIN